ncbi:MAG TPA: FAD-dependent oxidoreductase [Solirubrobacteraceae bacterium]|nr:FAD-dependent oxidoreductase [Solirubrobacteraceae bacterium]
MRRRAPAWAWRVGRTLTVAATGALCVALVAKPSIGLRLWWSLAIPSLPLLWLTAPGLWRNLCPLAASNQTPRALGLARGRTAPTWYSEYAPVAGMTVFILLVASRKPLLNSSGLATAALIGCSLFGALVGGFAFKGKSGWCSSICPLLPVQRVYGQTPYVAVANRYCQPCVGCAKNCYDFNPRVAYLADLYDSDRHYTGYRRLFVGAFPGLVYCYFTLPAHIGAAAVYGRFAICLAASAGSFFLGETLLRVTVNKLTAVYGAVALSLFYWYSAPVLAGTLTGRSSTGWFDWGLRAMAWALAAAWLVRTWRKEAVFVGVGSRASAARTLDGGLASARARRDTHPEVTIAPSGLRLVAKPGTTLLELLEAADTQIEAGCRMGVCGADPVRVLSGMENLSPIAPDERGTLDRLGYADSTRMACCARINGPLEVSVTPERRELAASPRIQGFAYDREVRRVVVIGNGIAGVTAADHVRRRHPECEIDIIADEPYPLYNRMGVSRLVYGRAAMVGLQLLPDDWYERNRISCWLNTSAQELDVSRREVMLGTGQALGYDRLILAMGADAFTPPIEGFGLPGTFVLRRAGDALAIRAYAQRHHATRAVVAGGGPLGLEAAYSIRRLGLNVTVLERGSRLLPRQLDARSSELLREYFEGLGVRIQLDSAPVAVRSTEGRLGGVVLSDGGELATELLLVAAGIAPMVELARKAGLDTRRGVVVDDRLRTSDPDVFAAGDLAQHQGTIYGLWPAAVEQGEIAAENAVGGTRAYGGTVPVAKLKVVGVELMSAGRCEPGEGDLVIVREDAHRHSYRKLVISDGRVVGAILIASPGNAADIAAAVRERRDVSAAIDKLQQGDWSCLAGDASENVVREPPRLRSPRSPEPWRGS